MDLVPGRQCKFHDLLPSLAVHKLLIELLILMHRAVPVYIVV